MFSSEAWLAKSGGFYNGVATQSLRRNDDDSAYLYRTPSSASNRKTFVFSCWYKRANLSGVNQPFFYAGSGGSDFTLFYIDGGSNRLSWYDYDGSTDYGQNLSIVLRDTSAWYHLVFAVDTTQGTDTNRVKIYVNGTLQTSVGADYGLLPQDYDTRVNDTKPHWLGRYNANYIDGYMAETNFVDGLSFFSDTSGTANTSFNVNSFGETKNGVWIAKKYTGSYGTNGFRLQFNQTGTGTASTSTIGADTSGNTNHYTSSGIVASDCDMPDSPENNFATALGTLAEPLDYQSYYKGTYSEGNLKVTGSSSGWSNGSSNFGMTSGKWYAECRINAKAGTGYIRFGMRARPARTYNEYFWNDDGTGQVDGTTSPYSGRVGTYTAGDILMVALDLENNAIYFGKNGTWENSATSSEISAGTTTNAFVVSTTIVPTGDDNSGHAYFFYCQPHSTGSNITWNFGQDSSFAGLETAQGNSDSGDGITDFYYTPPTGFLGNTTVNLPEPTISPNADTQADDYFNTVLYTGTGSSQAITGVGFQPDWVWTKGRSVAYSHYLFDSSRGVQKRLMTNNTNAEDTLSNGLTAFGTDGFTHGGEAGMGNNGDTFVAWNWKANGGTTTTNDASATGIGSQDSVYQANTTSGFSIVTYTGTGSNDTFAHGLGVAPKWIIHKKRNGAQHWVHYHVGIGNTRSVLFNTDAQNSASAVNFNNTSPTSTVFSLGTDAYANASGDTYIAYCFAEIEGFSRFGKYTGNSSTDGTFVYTGFRPAWIMFKRTDASGNGWGMKDTVRDSTNPNNGYLFAESSGAEGTATSLDIDFLSNGYKFRGTSSDGNASGGTYIYMAFAENPFKYANAR